VTQREVAWLAGRMLAQTGRKKLSTQSASKEAEQKCGGELENALALGQPVSIK
jgi:hypothetical protein